MAAAGRALMHSVDRDEHRRIADRRRRHAAHRRLGMAVMVYVGIIEHDLAAAAQPGAGIGLAFQETVHHPAAQVFGAGAFGKRQPGIADGVIDAVHMQRILHHRVADPVAPAGAGAVAEQDNLRPVQLHAR